MSEHLPLMHKKNVEEEQFVVVLYCAVCSYNKFSGSWYK